MCELLHVHIYVLHFTSLTMCILPEGEEEAEERGRGRGERGGGETDILTAIACKYGGSDDSIDRSEKCIFYRS